MVWVAGWSKVCGYAAVGKEVVEEGLKKRKHWRQYISTGRWKCVSGMFCE